MRKKYDCTKCLHEEICELWRKYEGQCAASFRVDGRCDYYKAKSRYIPVDELKGPGPDPRGPEGEAGRENGIFEDLMDIINNHK